MQNGFGFKPSARQRLAGGGVVDATVHAVKHLFGIDQQPQQPPRPVQQPSAPVQQVPQQPQSQITDYAGGGALKRREAELGLKAGGFVPASRRAAVPVAARVPVMPQQMPAQQPMQPGADQYGFKHGGFVPKSKRQQADRQIPPGQVQGPGTGTSDSVHGQVPTGSYIMPADSTAKIGPANIAQIGQPRDVALSNGEYHLPPEQVYAAGVQALDAARNATHAPVPADQMPRGFKPGRNFLTGGSVFGDPKTPKDLLLGQPAAAGGGDIPGPGAQQLATPTPQPSPNLPDYTNPASINASQPVLPGGDVSATPSQPAAKKSWTTLSPDDPNNVGMQQIRQAQADEQARNNSPFSHTRNALNGWDEQVKEQWNDGNRMNSVGRFLQGALVGADGLAFDIGKPLYNGVMGFFGQDGLPAQKSATPQQTATPATTATQSAAVAPVAPPVTDAKATNEEKKNNAEQAGPPVPTLAQRQEVFDDSMKGVRVGSDSVQRLAQNKDAQDAFNSLQAAKKNGITASTDASGHLSLTNIGFDPKAGQAATQGTGNAGPNIDIAGANARTQAALSMLGAQDNPAGPRGGSIANPDASNGLSAMMRPVRLPNGSYAYTSAQTQAAAQQQSQASSNAAQMQAQAMRDASQAQQTATTEAGADRRFAATNAISQSDLALRQQTQANQMRASKPLLDAQQRYLDAQTPEEKSLAAQQLRELQGKTTPSTWHPVVVPGGTDAMGNKSDPFVGSVNEQTGEFRRFNVAPQQQAPDYNAYAAQVRSKYPGKTVADEEIKALYAKQYGGKS